MKTKTDFIDSTHDFEFEVKMLFKTSLDLVDMAHEAQEGNVCQHCLDEHLTFLKKLIGDVSAELARCTALAADMGCAATESHVAPAN